MLSLKPVWRVTRFTLLVLITVATIGVFFLTVGPLGLNSAQDDANFITYRFATHLDAGRGLVYDAPGSAITTYPLPPVLLSGLTVITGDMPRAGLLLGIAARLIAAFLLARQIGLDSSNGRFAGLAFLLASLVWPSLTLMVMLAFALASLDAARHKQWVVSGAWIGLAILAEPSALIAGLLIGMLALREKHALRRFILPAALIPVLGLALVSLTADPTGKAQIAVSTPGLIVLAVPALSLVALARNIRALREQPHIGVLVAWSAITAAAAFLRGEWPTAVILPGTIALVALLPWRALAVLAINVDVILALTGFSLSPQIGAAQAAGTWIAAHSAPMDSLATTYTGALSYYADRPVIDLGGSLTSCAADGLDQAFFVRYAPNLLAIDDRQPVAWGNFKTTYTRGYSANGLSVYQLVANFTPLTDHPLGQNGLLFDANLNRGDLRLNGAAIADSLHPGDLARVRLDWTLAYAPSYDMEIHLNLLNSQRKSIDGVSDRFPAAYWRAGSNSTYHLIPLPVKNFPPGPVILAVGVTIRDGDLGTQDVTTVTIAAP